jgi:MinD superfamily P-loop ATPase
MKEIIIASGKGGAGKTGFCAVLCTLLGKIAVCVDADVDAANLNLLVEKNRIEGHDFISGYKAVINTQVCNGCGACEAVCRFDAIGKLDSKYSIDELSCEGCGACRDVCEYNAIDWHANHCGDWFISDTKFDSWLVHARLNPGGENSGKLVAEIRRAAKQLGSRIKADYILIDGPPGIGCPTISALTGTDLLIMVAEAGISGIHDSIRLLEIARQFQIETVCIMNKTGVNVDAESDFKEFLKTNNIPLIGEIPFNEEFMMLLNQQKTWLETKDPAVKKTLEGIWQNLQVIL